MMLIFSLLCKNAAWNHWRSIQSIGDILCYAYSFLNYIIKLNPHSRPSTIIFPRIFQSFSLYRLSCNCKLNAMWNVCHSLQNLDVSASTLTRIVHNSPFSFQFIQRLWSNWFPLNAFTFSFFSIFFPELFFSFYSFFLPLSFASFLFRAIFVSHNERERGNKSAI